VVPPEVAAAAGLRYRDRVRGTVDGVAFRSSLMKYSGVFHLGVHKSTLAAAGRAAGDRVRVTVESDPEPPPGEIVPEDVAAALAEEPGLLAAWNRLAPSHRREQVKHIEGARLAETRARRLARLKEELTGGGDSRTRPDR